MGNFPAPSKNEKPYWDGVIETHVEHQCNLACKSCSHYSNYTQKRRVSHKEELDSMRCWAKRIRTKTFSLVGGEPLLYSKIHEHLRECREIWGESTTIILVTNGFLLDRHSNTLPKAIEETDCQICISVHGDSQEYKNKVFDISETLRTRKWRNVNIHEWRHSYQGWRRVYKGHKDSMLPFNDKQPRKSWEICISKKCIQIFEGKLWKCPAIAYLNMQKENFRLSKEWDKYINAYKPLDLKCSVNQIQDFLSREEEFICGMCPAKVILDNQTQQR